MVGTTDYKFPVAGEKLDHAQRFCMYLRSCAKILWLFQVFSSKSPIIQQKHFSDYPKFFLYFMLSDGRLFTIIHECVKSVRIRSFSGMYFPAFELNTKRYEVY